ncbi:hypothetical protein C0993_006229 [Termitomyces sp. T159_Od127]|nr:hypothetical protein C0993_006229 [Termitomyces sp. T159_Od127]
MTLPPSPTLPIFSSAAPSSALPLPSNHGKLVAEAVGITIGLSLGLTAVVVLGCILWRRRKRWRPREDSEDDAAARPSRSLPPRESKAKATTIVSEAGRKSRASKPKAQKKDGEEKSGMTLFHHSARVGSTATYICYETLDSMISALSRMLINVA